MIKKLICKIFGHKWNMQKLYNGIQRNEYSKRLEKECKRCGHKQHTKQNDFIPIWYDGEL